MKSESAVKIANDIFRGINLVFDDFFFHHRFIPFVPLVQAIPTAARTSRWEGKEEEEEKKNRLQAVEREWSGIFVG